MVEVFGKQFLNELSDITWIDRVKSAETTFFEAVALLRERKHIDDCESPSGFPSIQLFPTRILRYVS